MKWIRIGLAVIILSVVLISRYMNHQKKDANIITILNEAKYDSTLAFYYGADEYGMKKYVMAFLKRGPNRIADSVEAMKLQMEHLKNIERLAEEGKLVLAGPFLDDGDLRGIYIFDVASVEEARKLTETDPAIQRGSLVMELKPFYCTAALKALNNLHKMVTKKEITEQ